MTKDSRIRIVVYLSLRAEDGGKFQYTLSLLLALLSLDHSHYSVCVISPGMRWDAVLQGHGIAVDRYIEFRRPLLESVFRKGVMMLPDGLRLWRRLGRQFDSFHRLLLGIDPFLTIFPGNESLSFEVPVRTVLPVFDLMHRYEPSFPEVASEYSRRERHYTNAARFVDLLLADSSLGKSQIVESYSADPDKIYVLPYVSPPFVDRMGEGRKPSYELPERFMFYPAQLWQHKNHLLILEALSILNRDGLCVSVVFVGSHKNGWKAIDEAIHRLRLEKQVSFLSFVSESELVYLYKHAVALVMPTFFGPTNIPPLEAFALGCPVLLSDIYASREQTADAAALFDPRDSAALADAIRRVWESDSLRQKLVLRGKERHNQWNQRQFNASVQRLMLQAQDQFKRGNPGNA